ncbi:MAG TPA: hypothetical protein VHW45_18875 [Candidatus Sulfotelmatobacter sp.]|jgi:hypothetical protein|nr:hypothetical protein [Candidatus Sulfotelmatobacter sp.]
MAVYKFTEQRIEECVAKRKRIRNWFGVIAVLVLAAVGLLYFFFPGTLILHVPIWGPLLGILVTIFLPWNWKSWPDKVRRSLLQTSVEISPSSVATSGLSEFKREFSIGEILRAEDAKFGGGYYLRTSNRYRWIVIPRRICGYDGINQELRTAGIRVVRTTIPPNWEEFAGMLLFGAILICSAAVHNIYLLSANLFVAVLLSYGVFFVVNANPDVKSHPMMRRAKFGAFLPAAFAAAGLWFALHR